LPPPYAFGAAWTAYHAYATTDPGYLLATSGGGNGSCPPGQQYKIYNYYCNIQATGIPVLEPTLNVGRTCRGVTSAATLTECDYVEAFIDTIVTTPPYPPIFYRCYWYSATPATTYETVAFEWSATSEYIEWYVKNIAQPNPPNSVQTLLGGLVPPVIDGYLVPLLKVTNHSPSLF
jgi:hypothetical protein